LAQHDVTTSHGQFLNPVGIIMIFEEMIDISGKNVYTMA